MRTSCWQMVEPPETSSPAERFWMAARTMPRKSMHGFVQKVWSSAATWACTRIWGISSNGTTRRCSAAKLASSTPSAETTVDPSLSSKFSRSDGFGRPVVNEA